MVILGPFLSNAWRSEGWASTEVMDALLWTGVVVTEPSDPSVAWVVLGDNIEVDPGGSWCFDRDEFVCLTCVVLLRSFDIKVSDSVLFGECVAPPSVLKVTFGKTVDAFPDLEEDFTVALWKLDVRHTV